MLHDGHGSTNNVLAPKSSHGYVSASINTRLSTNKTSEAAGSSPAVEEILDGSLIMYLRVTMSDYVQGSSLAALQLIL
jgi:hypothetical protein